MSTILKASFEHLCIIDCPASSTIKGLLCFMRKRATTSCNCSGSFVFVHLLCFGICAVLEAKQTSAASTSWRDVRRWAGADFVPLWFPETGVALTSHGNSHAHCSCCLWGAGQSNFYVFAVQRAGSLDWENALFLGHCETSIISVKLDPLDKKSVFIYLFFSDRDVLCV